MSEGAPKVFVVDDDPVVLKSLKRLLDFTGFATETFCSAQEFLAQVKPSVSGCLILDISMPELDGIQVQQTLTTRGNIMPIVFLTGHADVPTSVQAMKRGAVDLLEKPVGHGALLEALGRAMQRCEALQRDHQEIADIKERYAALTPREREVLAHLLAGQLNKQIAADLGTLECTVKAHRAQVMRKMRATTIAALVRLAVRGGIEPTATPATL